MEYVRGTTLRAWMSGSRRDPAELVRVAREIARGVAAAHAAGIVHRDLKPENVMITEDGGIKVLDFGLAKSVSSAASEEQDTATGAVTLEGQVVGTPSYMSPEQAKSKPVDARSDVFSLGVVLYEMAVGKRPFRGDSTVEVLISIDRDAPEPPRSIDARVPPVLERVILRCLEKAPADRFVDARALLRELEAYVAPAAGAATSRGRVVAAGAAVVALVGLVAMVALRWHASGVGPGIPASAGASAAPSSSASVVPTSLVGLPPPKSSNPEAVAAFQAAMQALHDEMFFEAVSDFEHAAQLDPTLAAAHLRLGLAKRWVHSPEEGRKSFAKAVQLRSSLSEHDRVLLDAAEPCVAREPYDLAEAEKRFLAAIERFPGDAELRLWLYSVYNDLGDLDRVLPLVDRLSEIDPSPVAWGARAFAHAYRGDAPGAREALGRCRQSAPTRASCTLEGQRILDDQGACDDLEAMGRGWISASPDEPDAYHLVAELLLAKGAAPEAVRDAYEQAHGHMPASDRADAVLEDGLQMDLFRGDFVAAEETLHKMGGPTPPRWVLRRLRDLFVETGRPAQARAVADDFFRRRAAWPAFRAGDDAALFNDHTGVMLESQLRAGELSRADFSAKRDAWVAEVDARTTGHYRDEVWVPAYAELARTPDEASEALDALAKRGKLAPWYWFSRAYGAIGRVYELAGRHAEALPWLRHATSLCLRKDPGDRLYLGMALEGTGDTNGACRAYDEVIARWGGARPRSVTADAARQHRAALACSSDGGAH